MLIDDRYNESKSNRIVPCGTERGVCKSVIAKVCDNGSFFQSEIFASHSAAVRISGVSVIKRCLRGEG